jgi:HlyD family secretion protein
MTAIVVLGESQRERAVRIPNGALAFRPAPDVWHELDAPEPSGSAAATVATDGGATSTVWEYDGKRFTRIAVHVGLADSQWTELLSGSIRPGDALVTRAVLRQRSRLSRL